MQYRQMRVIGGRGAAPAQFTEPLRAIAVDSQDSLYVISGATVRVFNHAGEFQRSWPVASPAYAIAVAGDGSVYVGQAGQIEVFSATGELAGTWRDPERLGLVTAIGFLDGDVLVGDARDRCIRRYSSGGEFLRDIGKDNRRKGFLIPNGIVDFSVDSGGIIHATNPGKHRVERYTGDDELLGHIGRFDGLDPAGFPGCCNPTNVFVTGRDRIYVTEKAGARAKVYDSDGNLLAVIAEEVFDPGCKNMDIAVDSRGRVYIVDTVKLQILAFEPVQENALLEAEGTLRS